MDANKFEQEQEHEVYGAEIPIDAEDDAETSAKADNQATASKEELETVMKRMKEIEEEAVSLRAKFDKGIVAAAQGQEIPAGAAVDLAEKEEVDSRSIFVGNVDYECTPEEVQQHFQSCGTVNRVTILTDEFGNPKGFAYVEFVETEAVTSALLLNETELHGRTLKVSPKRTNIPGMRQHRGRRFRRPFMPDPIFYAPYSYGRVPRYRRPMRYSPY